MWPLQRWSRRRWAISHCVQELQMTCVRACARVHAYTHACVNPCVYACICVHACSTWRHGPLVPRRGDKKYLRVQRLPDLLQGGLLRLFTQWLPVLLKHTVYLLCVLLQAPCLLFWFPDVQLFSLRLMINQAFHLFHFFEHSSSRSSLSSSRLIDAWGLTASIGRGKNMSVACSAAVQTFPDWFLFYFCCQQFLRCIDHRELLSFHSYLLDACICCPALHLKSLQPSERITQAIFAELINFGRGGILSKAPEFYCLHSVFSSFVCVVSSFIRPTPGTSCRLCVDWMASCYDLSAQIWKGSGRGPWRHYRHTRFQNSTLKSKLPH